MKLLFESLLFPPGLVVLIAVIGLLLLRGRPRAGAWTIGGAITLLYVLSLPVTAAAVMGLLQTYPALTRDVIAHSGAQAIVVLAGGRYERAPEYGGDTISSLTLERLRYGVHLQRETRLPLLMSGGNPDDDVLPEAALLKEAAVDEFAVPVWLTEERSRTTLENAAYASAELRRRGITRVLLVTHAWHMPRAMWSFEQAGLGAVAAPTGFVTADLSKPASWLPSTGALAHTRYAMHEILGLLWYRISKNARDI